MSAQTIPETYADAHVEVNYRRHEVRSGGQLRDITPTEWRILCEFVKRRGTALSWEHLGFTWYPEAYAFGDPDMQTKWHVSNLRRKLGWPKEGPLVTIRGFGYRYDPDYQPKGKQK